jgi:hypothetical protein
MTPIFICDHTALAPLVAELARQSVNGAIVVVSDEPRHPDVVNINAADAFKLIAETLNSSRYDYYVPDLREPLAFSPPAITPTRARLFSACRARELPPARVDGYG